MSRILLHLEGLIELPDLSNNHEATKLNCSNNYLTYIDCSKLPPNLEILECEFNQITEFINHFPASLKELHCHYNKLQHLDNLPFNLRILDCENNNL